MPGLETATKPQPVQAMILADTRTVLPGRPFRVGIRLTMLPRWHVYWRNPGPAGIPTEVTFTLPDGFHVGPLLWPIPEAFIQPGGIAGYGYGEQVLLTAKITPPEKLDIEQMTITATADWLACREVCIPGRQRLTLTLPVGDEPRPTYEQLFSETLAQVPDPADDPNTGYAVTVEGELPRAGEGATFKFKLLWPAPVQQLRFFPPYSDALEFAKATSTSTDNATEMQVHVRRLPGQDLPPGRLDAVVVAEMLESRGQRIRRGVIVPLREPTRANESDQP